MKLGDLEPGQRFRLNYNGQTGALVSVGTGGSRVLYDSAQRKVEFTAKSGDEVVAEVAFEAPGRPILISSGTEVTPL